MLVRRPNITLVDTSRRREIASVGDIYRGAVRLDQLPPYVPGAMVAVEDRRFYHHFGVDLIGLARADALWINVRMPVAMSCRAARPSPSRLPRTCF